MLNFSFYTLFLSLSTLTAVQAETVRLDRAGQFFADGQASNQGGLSTCYAHPATQLVDEYLNRQSETGSSFKHASPLATALLTLEAFPEHVESSASLFENRSAPSANLNLSSAQHINDLEGGNVGLAISAVLMSGERLNYDDVEGKLANPKLQPAVFSSNDLFGTALDQNFSQCRQALAHLATPPNVRLGISTDSEMRHMGENQIPACAEFERELERADFVWQNPPTGFDNLKGKHFTVHNSVRAPELNALRYLMVRSQNSFYSMQQVFSAFARKDQFPALDANAHSGLIQRFRFRSSHQPVSHGESKFIENHLDPKPEQLHQLVMEHLRAGHPVAVCLDLGPLEQTKFGVSAYYESARNRAPLGHCMTIVGFRSKASRADGFNIAHYLIKNSWRHSAESRCSGALKNASLVQCEVQPLVGGAPGETKDTGNFWLSAKGMIEIMKRNGELSFIAN